MLLAAVASSARLAIMRAHVTCVKIAIIFGL
jgi:hypothetical protein